MFDRGVRPGRRLAAAIAMGLGAALALAACGSSSSADNAGAGNGLVTGTSSAQMAASGVRLGVVAGENFWGNIAAQIGGSHVTVTSIISDPNADPHEYETDVNDAAAIAHANLVIENGAGYDDFMSKLVSAAPKKTRAELDIAQLVGVSGSNPNPHLWYDPSYVDAAATAMATELASLQPGAARTFQANLRTFLAGEARVVAVISQIKARYDGTAIAYTERVPGYLITAAGLHLGTPAAFSQAIEDGTDPSPLDNAVFEKALADRSVKALLYNAQVADSDTGHLRSLAERDHVPVVGVTETLPPDEDFQTWQANQAEALLTALGG